MLFSAVLQYRHQHTISPPKIQTFVCKTFTDRQFGFSKDPQIHPLWSKIQVEKMCCPLILSILLCCASMSQFEDSIVQAYSSAPPRCTTPSGTPSATSRVRRRRSRGWTPKTSWNTRRRTNYSTSRFWSTAECACSWCRCLCWRSGSTLPSSTWWVAAGSQARNAGIRLQQWGKIHLYVAITQ